MVVVNFKSLKGENMKELIEALATLGIVIPDGTPMSDLPKLLKQNKKVLKAHDELNAAKAVGAEEEEEEDTPPPAKKEEEDDTPPPAKKEEEDDTPPPAVKIPPKAVIVKKEETENKPVKNKFVTQR